MLGHEVRDVPVSLSLLGLHARIPLSLVCSGAGRGQGGWKEVRRGDRERDRERVQGKERGNKTQRMVQEAEER
jgi:hypothetical protein